MRVLKPIKRLGHNVDRFDEARFQIWRRCLALHDRWALGTWRPFTVARLQDDRQCVGLPCVMESEGTSVATALRRFGYEVYLVLPENAPMISTNIDCTSRTLNTNMVMAPKTTQVLNVIDTIRHIPARMRLHFTRIASLQQKSKKHVMRLSHVHLIPRSRLPLAFLCLRQTQILLQYTHGILGFMNTSEWYCSLSCSFASLNLPSLHYLLRHLSISPCPH
jgi:hypothetical protein